MIYRAAQTTEAEAVLALWREAEATVSLTDRLEDIQSAMVVNSTHFLVAEHDGQIVGTVIGAFDGWRGNLYRLVVHPDFRRFGVATALVAEVQKRFLQQGVKRITALVEKDHPDAVSFWRAVGYELDTRIARYVHNL